MIPVDMGADLDDVLRGTVSLTALAASLRSRLDAIEGKEERRDDCQQPGLRIVITIEDDAAIVEVERYSF
ncbi:MAG: hypothetical protein QOD92_3654 [Acidimicrobiaceae bacterium]|jgi:hypothetical protein